MATGTDVGEREGGGLSPPLAFNQPEGLSTEFRYVRGLLSITVVAHTVETLTDGSWSHGKLTASVDRQLL